MGKGGGEEGYSWSPKLLIPARGGGGAVSVFNGKVHFPSQTGRSCRQISRCSVLLVLFPSDIRYCNVARAVCRGLVRLSVIERSLAALQLGGGCCGM